MSLLRVKRIKGAFEIVKSSPYVLKENDKIQTNKKIHLELGAGKGQFIFSLANEHKDIMFVAVEQNSSVCYRIVQKQEEQQLNNIKIINDNALHILNHFNLKSVDKIYLNFSDPRPKPRHHKRRLTYPIMLKIYKQLLADNGVIEVRTDSLELFEASIEYFEIEKFKLYDIMYMSPENKHMSEYENLKRQNGPIYSLKAKVEA